MARMRSLRPDYFLREDMADVSLEAHFLLAGLAVLADRDGRLLDRPRTIKAQVFPFREVDIEAALGELVRAGVIARYKVGGRACIALLTWEVDQTPHPKETSLGLPPPPDDSGMSGDFHATTQPSRNVGHASGMNAEPSGRDPLGLGVGIGSRDGSGSKMGPSSASQGASAPDAGEDLPDATADAVEVEKPSAVTAFVAQAPLLPEAVTAPPKPTGPKPETLRDLWNRLAVPKGLSRWEAMSKAREGACRSALAAVPDLAKWEAWLSHELARPWNLGENGSGWRADVDWFLRAKTRDLVADFNPATAPKPPPSAAPTKPTKFIEM